MACVIMRSTANLFCLLAAMGLWFPCLCGVTQVAGAVAPASLAAAVAPSLGAPPDGDVRACCQTRTAPAIPFDAGSPAQFPGHAADDCCCPLGEIPNADRVQQATAPPVSWSLAATHGELGLAPWQRFLLRPQSGGVASSLAMQEAGPEPESAARRCARLCSWVN